MDDEMAKYESLKRAKKKGARLKNYISYQTFISDKEGNLMSEYTEIQFIEDQSTVEIYANPGYKLEKVIITREDSKC